MKAKKSIGMSLVILLCLFQNPLLAYASDSNTDGFAEKQPITCSYISEFSDGGKDYIYILDDGNELHALVPPPGFDPLTASDEDLEKYCFPSRPTSENEREVSESYNNWVQMISCYTSTPEPDYSTMITTQTQTSRTMAEPGYSGNWSGHAVYADGVSTFFTQVEMVYTEPDIISHPSKLCANYQWVGLGGSNSMSLVQAGTYIDDTDKTVTELIHYPAVMYQPKYGGTYVRLLNTKLTVNPGDEIFVYATFQKANDKFGYYIANNTTGQSTNGYISLDADIYFDGSSAEWIIERMVTYTPDGPVNRGLANFGTLQLRNCMLTSNVSSAWTGAYGRKDLQKITLTSNGRSSGLVLCHTEEMQRGNKFTTTWLNYSG